jgi:hypothetical protein
MAAIQSSRRARLLVAAAIASALTGAVVVACSSNDNNPQPPNQQYDVDASNTVPDAPTSTGDDASNPNPGDDGSTADVREEPVPRDAACLIDQPAAQGAPANSTCYDCQPGINSDFLNHCAATGIVCVPFDNSRLPGYDGGALPPLQ